MQRSELASLIVVMTDGGVQMGVDLHTVRAVRASQPGTEQEPEPAADVNPWGR